MLARIAPEQLEVVFLHESDLDGNRCLSVQLFVVEDLDIGVEGFRAISALPDLRSLILTSCDGIDRSGLELLCGMSNLQYLDMSDVWEFAGDTLQPLASLTNLQVRPPLCQ